MKNKSHNDIFLFAIFLALTFLFYDKTKDAKFLSDFYSWVGSFDEYGAKGLRVNFGYHGLIYVNTFLFFTAYKLLGLNSVLWHVLFVFLHCTNAFLVLKLGKVLLRFLPLADRNMAAFFGAIFFLLSPYQTETVVWAATLHYLTTTLAILATCLLLINFLETPKLVLATTVFFLFLIGLLNLEVTFVLPGVLFCFFFLFRKTGRVNVSYNKYFSLILFPQLAALAGYFLVNKFLFGSWIGHYGKSTHLNVKLMGIVSGFMDYCLKFFALFRYLPIEKKYHAIEYLHQDLFIYTFMILLAILSFFTVYWYRKRKSAKIILLATLFSIFFLMLLPVLNLEKTSLIDIQSDRYGYVASAFFYLFLSALTFFLLGRLSFLVNALIILLFSLTLYQTTVEWKKGGILAHSLLSNFKWLDANRVYILNLPDNLNGVYIFRNGFREAIQKTYGKDLRENIKILSYINLFSLTDTLRVVQKSDDKFLVQIGRWGQWFSYKENSSSEFETVFFDGWYDLKFDKVYPHSYAIYQNGTTWKQIELTPPN